MKNDLVKDYYLGLDIGTNSVGWAVTDEDYNICQFRNRAMWGVHVFDSGNPAEKRRIYRTARRRFDRRRWRIGLLQDIFGSEIDRMFFDTLKDSGLREEDRKNGQGTPPSIRKFYKDFHKEYPTIYHLRYDMMTTESEPDMRLVYLAIHHIIKYRGHFLFEGLSDGKGIDFEETFSRLIDRVNEEQEFGLSLDRMDKIKDVLKDTSLNLKGKREMISELTGAKKKEEKLFIGMLAGGTAKIDKIFGDESLNDISFSFGDPDFSDILEENEDRMDPSVYDSILLSKQIFDWMVLDNVLRGGNSISEAKIAEYEQHRTDLELLKSTIKKYAPERYKEIFKSKNIKNNYCAYLGEFKTNRPEEKMCSQEDFCGYLKKILDAIENLPENTKDMLRKIDEGVFMPKQTSRLNSIIPSSVHKYELERIISNASRFFPFFDRVDGGISVRERLLELFEFRVPYYVGPLNERSERAWLHKRSNEVITPWNFEDIVDVDKSSVNFIDNLIGECRYLHNEKVIPKNSLLYSRFEVLSELNNLRMNGRDLTAEVKQRILHDMFENVTSVKKVTIKSINRYLRKEGLISSSDEITGTGDEIKSNLRSLVLIRNIIGNKISDIPMAEKIIRDITIFGAERLRLKNRLISDHSDDLSEDEIEKLSKLTFKGWGRFSERLLNGILGEGPCSKEPQTIIALMESTNKNFNTIFEEYGFRKQAENMNSVPLADKISYSAVEKMHVSPAVKRSIWRTLAVIRDIVKAMGKNPKKVFVETNRRKGEGSTTSRKEELRAVFKKNGDPEWAGKIDEESDMELRKKSVYLYYKQYGKCVYCGDEIKRAALDDKKIADCDHIYPRSKKKDDSIHNNLVLACRECNDKKYNNFPVSKEWQDKMGPFWDLLKKNKLMTAEKYYRLTRTEGFGEEELSGFINRQIVETNQAILEVIKFLKSAFADGSDVIYVRGNNVSRFRNDFGKEYLCFKKCRMVNDYHHAKDAYLSIVVGNAYDVKFTRNPLNFIRSGENYNISDMFEETISRGNTTAWVPDETIRTIEKHMRRNNILFTRFSARNKGELFDQTLYGPSENLFRKKEGLDPKYYGGYKSTKGAYFVLAEHESDNRRVVSLEQVPVYLANAKPNKKELCRYFTEEKGLHDPNILINRIKMDTLFEFDRFRCYLTGRTNDRVIFAPGIQIILPYDLYNYCDSINRFIAAPKTKIRSVEDHGISREWNERLYDTLVHKSKGRQYGGFFDKLSAKLEVSREKFVLADTEVQTKMLYQLLKVFKCDSSYADLSEINVSATGRITTNKRILTLGHETVKIVHQSPSGLFEEKVDLKKYYSENDVELIV